MQGWDTLMNSICIDIIQRFINFREGSSLGGGPPGKVKRKKLKAKAAAKAAKAAGGGGDE